ncbi:MAG: 30S ribosomal protein S20 [Alphaproteobacteria bacterium]|nr:30S ribosomal protein S20 [Alphaproteobacteria bacterium]
MANHHSSKIRIKRNAKAQTVNTAYVAQLKTIVRSLEKLIAAGEKEAAKAQMPKTESALTKAAKKGVIKQKAASRKTSRLNAKIKKMA